MPAPLTLPVAYGRRKPPLGAPLRRGLPLARGLALSFDLREGAGSVRDAVTGLVLAPQNGPSWGACADGRAGVSTANDAGWSGLLPAALQTSALTLVWRGVLLGTPSASSGIWGTDYGGTDASPFISAGLEFNSGPSAWELFYAMGGTFHQLDAPGLPPAGKLTTLVATIQSGDQAIYQDGALVGTDTQSGSLTWASGTKLYLGCYFTGLGRASNTATSMARWYSRVLSPGEIRALSLRPFGVVY